jgi:PAS domain S-box-containing protein
MPVPSLSPVRRWGFEWLLLSAALLLLGGLTAWSLWLQYQRLEQEENDRLQALALTLGEAIGHRLGAAERALPVIAGDMGYWRGGADRASRVQALARMLDGIPSLLVLDAEGRVIAASRAELIGRDFAAREFFTGARAQPGARWLYLDAEADNARARSGLGVSRAIIDGHGSFAGVVAAVLDGDYLRSLMESGRYAPDIRLLLAHADGRPYVAAPGNGQAWDLTGAASWFAHHREHGQRVSLMNRAIHARGEDLVIAVHALQTDSSAADADLLLAVARERVLVHAQWRREEAWHGGLFLATLLLSVVALQALQQRQRRLDALRATRAAELRAAAERLRLAADAAGLGVWEYEPAGSRVYWDASMYALYGVDALPPVTTYDEWRGKVLPDDLPAVEAALQASIRERKQFRGDFRIRRGDGQIRMISALARPLLPADGSTVRVVGINQDVTERWQAEAAALASEAYLKAIFDVVPIGISVLDQTGRIVDCNATAERLLGVSREQPFPDRSDSPFWTVRRSDGSVMPREEYAWVRALASGVAVFDLDLVIEMPTGAHWLSVSAVPIAASPGGRSAAGGELATECAQDTSGVVMACVDVGAARRNEAELRQLSRAVEQSAAAVLITDIDGRIEYVNPAACAAYGYSSAELLGANPRLLGSGLTPLSTYQAMWSTILAGKAWRGELANRRRDGSLIHEAVSISPVCDRAGQMTHFVSIQEDVSARVEAERLQDELKTRLGRVARMDVLGVMAGGVAHDFNNILVAILGFSGLGKSVLRATGGAERLLSYFEEIEAAGERARALVQQLLAFSRAGALKLAVVSVAAVAGEVVGLIAPCLPTSLTLSTDIDDDLPLLDVDPAHLHRLLLNLCLNARDAMEGPGAVVISARLVCLEAAAVCASCHGEFSGEFLRLSVSDQGRGFPEAIRDRIFEPFFTTREVGAGSGMGLAVVHGLTHLYQGHLQVFSAPDQGSEVAILLPRSMWHLDAAAEPGGGVNTE